MEKLYFKNKLHHSNSQPYINHKSHKDNRYILSQSSINNHKNYILPSVGNKIKYENGGYRHTHQTLDSSFNSSYQYPTKKRLKNFSNYLRNINFKAKRDNYRAQKKLNHILNETKKLPSLLDYKINSALSNKKLKDELDENIRRSHFRNNLHDELYRQRALDDLKFKRDLDEIEANRENIRLKRRRMINELKNQEFDDLESSLYLPPPLPPPPYYPPYIPPQYYYPPVYNNNNGDSIGELVKFFLVKKLFDESKQPFIYPQYPYIPGYPYPFIYDPNFKNILSKMKPLTYQMPPIIIQNPVQNTTNKPPTKKKDNNSNIITESQKGIPFVDPLEKYLDMVNRLKKSNKDEKKGKKGSNGDGENGEGDGEDGDEDGGDGEGDGDGEGEGGDGEGDEDMGDGDGEGGDGEGDEDGGEE